ncbi:sensor histidine kinase [Siphonobacter sp. SORGH_AS_1065]|uniref:sensor histidine kinase n=1 Tax=Siphonobacter sp. SORGH_AS_1065 TaxID=3041795 RepID=UPI00278817A8|nr:histidine kinase [Siphonobacter sp. SORGH_AS_1065]MDQ1087218.1 two-component system LytT family sensor kinase [Siphonobacter sp. SORGH_AS_1065]
MRDLKFKKFSQSLTVLMHLAFWAFFLSLPFLLRSPQNPPGTPRVKVPDEVIILLNMLTIPLFYINANIFIPRVLKRQGVWFYVAYILLSMTAVLSINLSLRNYVFFPELPSARITIYTLFPVFFILAVSTTYRLLSDYLADEQQRKELENEQLKSELSFLRSQISPHFMFNVLNSIVSLSRKKSDMVEPVVIQLSDLMRYMLYESNGTRVSLEKEIKYLNNYIDLQRIRFGNDVKINFEADNRLSHQPIEPMLLIPFVENAFKHGVGIISDPVIDIMLQAQGKTLIFKVRNKVNRRFKEVKDSSSGIGLPNVQRRLSLLYPESHELTISETGEWYEVQLSLHFNGDHPLKDRSLTEAING